MIELKKNKKNKKGMTFVEVIITIGIFSVVMIGINQLVIKSWQNYNLIMHTSEASIAANRGISAIVDVLRKMREADSGSYPIVSASSFDLKFFSDIDKDGVTEKIHYYLEGTNLMIGQSKPSGFPLSYPAGDNEIKILIKNVANTTTQPLFYYYNSTNNIVGNPASNLNSIRMVKINIFIKRKEGNLNIESFVSLRNLNENDNIK